MQPVLICTVPVPYSRYNGFIRNSETIANRLALITGNYVYLYQVGKYISVVFIRNSEMLMVFF
jgi:hypothetical protein